MKQEDAVLDSGMKCGYVNHICYDIRRREDESLDR